MKNSLKISAAGEDLLSTADDGTNRLFINGTEISSASWTGSGTYTATVAGHAITIAQVEDTSGNIALRKTGSYTYELYKLRGSVEPPAIPAYQSGDTDTPVTAASNEKEALIVGGLLTNSRTWMCFTMQTAKSMESVVPGITSLKVNPRNSSGGYMIGSGYVNGGTQCVASGYTVTATKTDNYHITIVVEHSTYNGTNNTPCVVEIDELALSFT